MNIDYWLLETQEDIENYELSTDIASPAEMAHAIKRVRDVITNELYQDEANVDVVTVEDIVKALDGGNE